MKNLEVRYVNGGLGRNNPARVDLDTGVVEVNAPLFRHYTPLQKKLVLLHEAGHVRYDTVDDEELADRYALEQVAGTVQYSLRRSVDGLLAILEQADVSEERKKKVIISALEIDAERFGNEHAKALLEEIRKEPRLANAALSAAAIAAIVSAAIALIGFLQQTIFGKRAAWFAGDMGGKKRTQHKINLLQDACDSVGAKAIKLKATSQREDGGELLVYEQLDDDDWVYNEVHAALYTAFKDNNIFSPSFFRSRSKFYDKCGWAKEEIQDYLPTVRSYVRNEFAKKGYSDPNSSGDNSLSIASNGNNLLRYAVIGLVLLLILKKVF